MSENFILNYAYQSNTLQHNTVLSVSEKLVNLNIILVTKTYIIGNALTLHSLRLCHHYYESVLTYVKNKELLCSQLFFSYVSTFLN